MMDFILSSPILLIMARYLINGMIPTVSVVLLGAALIGLKINIRQLILFCLAGIITYGIKSTVNPPIGINVLILVVCMAVATHYILKINFLTAVTVAVIGEFIVSLIETPLLDMYFWFSGIDKSIIWQGTNLGVRFSILLINGATCLIIYAILTRYNINLKNLLKRKNIYSEDDQQRFFINLLPMIMLLLVPILTLICLNDAIQIFAELDIIEKYWNVFHSIDIFLIFVLSGTSMYAIIKIFKFLENEYFTKVAYGSMSLLEDMVSNIRKQRHDFNHHLQTVYGLVEINEFNRAKDYIRKTVETVSARNELIKTDNHYISSLLYTKIGFAEENRINMELSIVGSLKNLPINDHEFTSVLGNLLDNAISAVKNNDLTDRSIKVDINRSPRSLTVIVANRGSIPEEIVSKIFEPNFSTKGSHGLGLPIIKEIIERHGGKLTLSVKDNDITFSSSIPLPA